jgi:DMSO reductase anchor subunit
MTKEFSESDSQKHLRHPLRAAQDYWRLRNGSGLTNEALTAVDFFVSAEPTAEGVLSEEMENASSSTEIGVPF